MAYVAENTCGSCKNYEYAGEYQKGYCSYYRSYYYHDDSCSHWERGNVTSASSGCFLTTACCEYMGLPDDCRELTVMRNVRDTYLKNTDIGKAMIDLYYEKAPDIVAKLDKKINKSEIYKNIYDKICRITDLAEKQRLPEAVGEYVALVMYAEKEAADN